MKKIKIGVLCPSEIAYRRFMPALQKIDIIEYVGIGVATEEEWFGSTGKSSQQQVIYQEYEKAKKFQNEYGGVIFNSYQEIIESSQIDAIYIPLPPALHYKWAKKCLQYNKHVFVEKPATTNIDDTEELIDIASQKELAFHENYMFVYHSQLEFIKNLLKEEKIGKIWQYRISFGFPFRGNQDFRYNKSLGGGALLDCGGYTLKLASLLLGEKVRVTNSKLIISEDLNVDIFGSGVLENDLSQNAFVSFGMDNSYKCELEIWGSKGTIYTNRILTAPDKYCPVINVEVLGKKEEFVLDYDDSFMKSILYFCKCINDDKVRNKEYKDILIQAKFVEEFKEK